MCKFGSAGRIILCHFISLESNTSDFYDQWIFMIFIVSARHLEFSPKLWKSSHISSEADTFLSHNITRRYSFDGANNGENFISRDTTIFLWQHLEKSNLNPVWIQFKSWSDSKFYEKDSSFSVNIPGWLNFCYLQQQQVNAWKQNGSCKEVKGCASVVDSKLKILQQSVDNSPRLFCYNKNICLKKLQ